MKGTAGKVYNVNEGHEPVAGCTISTALWEDDKHTLTLFSLGAGTDISQELYAYRRIQLVVDGSMNATGDQIQELRSGDAIVTPIGTPVGVHAEDEAIYLELALDLESTVNDAIPEGEAFRLADLVPYREGHIVNMDVANDATFKLALLSFDAGTGLSPHGAPGDALLLALDGEAVIDYESVEYPICAGQAFKFDAGGRHAIRAYKPFKMALLVTLGA